MRDEEKTKEQLISELVELRQSISELKELELVLRESERDYRDLFECSIDGLAVIDAETMKIILCNQRAASLYGFKSPDDTIGVNPLDFIHPDDKERTIQHIVDYLFKQDLREANVFRTLTKDGKDKWISAVGIVIDYHGKKAALASFRDITRSKLTEDALRQSEEKLRLTFESIKEGITIADLEGRIIMTNEAGLRMSGYKRKEELIGRSGLEFILETDRSSAIADLLKQLKNEVGSTLSYYTIVDKYGIKYDAEVSASVMPDIHGTPAGFIVVVRDITERKRAIEELRKSEERYRLVTENVSDVIWIMDMNANYVYISPSIESMSGYTPEELMKVPAQKFVTPKSAAVVLKVLSEELALEIAGKSEPHRVSTLELEAQKKDGSSLWLEVKITLMRDQENKFIGLLGVSRDVSERKLAEKRLRDSEEKYKELVEQEKDVIFSVDASGHFTSINSAALSWGFKPEQLIGRHFSEFILPEWHDVLPSALDQILTADEITAELVVSDSKGKGHPIEFSATVIREGSEYRGVRGIVRDITERKQIEEALRDSEEKLRLTFESINEGIILTDLEGHILDINEAGFRMSGYDLKSQVIGLDGLQFFEEKARPSVLEQLAKLLKEGRIPIMSYKIVSRTGQVYDSEASAVLLRDNT